MKKGYYLHEQLEGTNSIGVEKKIQNQIKVFSEKYEMQRIPMTRIKGHTLEKRMFWFDRLYNVDEVFEQLDEPAFIYMRKVVIDKTLVRFFHRVKKDYPTCKVIIELFTYPYDIDCYLKKEVFATYFLYYLKEVYYRRKLVGLVDRWVTYSNDAEIWGIPTIQTMNGICIDDIYQHKKEWGQEELHLISVAMFQIHHGYDRLLEGLVKYYRNQPTIKVIYHLVGDGTELERYKKIVKQGNIQEYVQFCGKLDGEALDNVFEQADIAVASLGMHRIKVTYSSSLKTKEYMARGIPFIYAGDIDVLKDQHSIYAMRIPSNENAVDINDVLDYWKDIKKQKDSISISNEMRKQARDTIDMQTTLQAVMEYIN